MSVSTQTPALKIDHSHKYRKNLDIKAQMTGTKSVVLTAGEAPVNWVNPVTCKPF